MLDPLRKVLDTWGEELPTDASRLFHGRGHCYTDLSFLTIDWFAPVLRAVIYGEPADQRIAELRRILREFAQAHPEITCISIQRRHHGRAEHEVILGTLPDACHARESGAMFELNLASNQNIGYFLDAAPGRSWLRDRAAGRRVLNLFAYTCSFSVAALIAGADHVVNIDMSKSAIATGQRNHSRNNISPGRATFLPHNIFRSTRKLEKLGPYDLVIIDPPSRQKGSFEVDRDYKKLLAKLPPMLAPRCEILACLNAPYLDEHFLPSLFEEILPDCQYVQRLPGREDLPEVDPQRGLKMQVFRKEP